MINHPNKIISPLLNRLIDFSSNSRYDVLMSRYISVKELYECIRNHLEQLLNSRKKWLALPENLPELEKSVINYGLLDFTHHYFNHHHAQIRLCKDIQLLIEHFEPRLTRVVVRLEKNELALERTLKLRIEANMKWIADDNAVAFESAIDFVNNAFEFD